MKKIRWLDTALVLLAAGGVFDSAYLTYEHYRKFIPPCATGWFVDCGKVLSSQYATIMGVPLAVIGLVYYSILTILLISTYLRPFSQARYALLIQTGVGFISSVYFVYLQVWVLRAVCLYCMVSALISVSVFIGVYRLFHHERKRLAGIILGIFYKYLIKHFFFKLDPELIHTLMTHMGEMMGRSAAVRHIIRSTLAGTHPSLKQTCAGITFQTPVGLAAGFDYEARLTQCLAPLGFGFQTIGTMTYKSYKGNLRPMLGRLPRSRALMVNKGFKNPGIRSIINKLKPLSFEIPLGISIGRTNTAEIATQKDAVADIIGAFERVEQSSLKHAYYELNISCPNLQGSVTFYPSENLHELLQAVDSLRIQRPIMVKMPIEKNNEETEELLDVISSHCPRGVIFGNLQKNRKDPSLVPEEVAQFTRGNFSGKPTQQRSNELIQLAYRHFKERFLIVGCGGIFSGQDAYEKITLGASLVQLITGMIFEGPQLVSQINFDLEELLRRDGFTHLSQAVGSRNLSTLY